MGLLRLHFWHLKTSKTSLCHLYVTDRSLQDRLACFWWWGCSAGVSRCLSSGTASDWKTCTDVQRPCVHYLKIAHSYIWYVIEVLLRWTLLVCTSGCIPNLISQKRTWDTTFFFAYIWNQYLIWVKKILVGSLLNKTFLSLWISTLFLNEEL